MKKLDPKFFITCGAIILIPVMIVIIMFAIRGCSDGKSYEQYENMMVDAAKSYAKKHKMLPSKSKQVIIKLSDLENDGLKSVEKSLKDTTCNGSVTIQNNSNSISSEKYYSYTPYLECSNYKTDYIKDHLMKDLTESKSGLYKIDNEYIYKGNKVNNYISFYGTIYRVIKIDENNNLKLIKTNSQQIASSWDHKYNIDNKSYDGINNYTDSVIIDRLKTDYKKDKTLKDVAKNMLVVHSVCIGKRSLNDLSKNITNECSDILEDQVISLPSITDFMLASYDANCNNIGDLSCTNYNYFIDFIDFTWTLDTISDDSTQVYYLSSLGANLEVANRYENYNWVIYISADTVYQGGTGTSSNPYIIK